MNKNASIEIVRDAVIAPLMSLTPAAPPLYGRFDGGVYYEDGSVCLQGLHGKTHYTNEPAPLMSKNFDTLNGGYIFGGMLQEHFGHFLTESLGRLWGASYLCSDFSSILFYHRIPGGKLPAFASDLLGMIAPNLNIILLSKPARIESLAVPTHIEKNGVLYGHSVMREVVNPLKEIRAAGGKRIYVSRSKLSLFDGGLIHEDLVEKNLRIDGYDVIYPEKMTVREQLAAYNGAEEIIFSEGSAIHLYALVARPSQRVFVIWRRKLAEHFGWQISSFGGPKIVYGKPCIKNLWVPPRGLVGAKAVLDLKVLSHQLCSAGFISRAEWESASEADADQEMDRIQHITKTHYSKQPAV